MQRPPASGKVFILYCKDPYLPPTFSDDVLDLADILSHCGGFICMVDHYVDVHQPNWNTWTENKIVESQFVLLVCSPTLAQLLRQPLEYMLNMEKGKYYVNSIVNHIRPSKFIPVFLNRNVPQPSYLDWVPSQLHASAAYFLNVSELYSVLTVAEGTPRHVFDEKLRAALSEDRFREIAKLVYHLRGETATSPPVPPPQPIEISSTVAYPSHHPLSVSGARSSGRHEPIPSSTLDILAQRLSRDWFTCGIKLGVDSTLLLNLQSKYPNDAKSACLETFNIWQQSKGRSATRKALKDVLVRMEYGRLAGELFPNV